MEKTAQQTLLFTCVNRPGKVANSGCLDLTGPRLPHARSGQRSVVEMQWFHSRFSGRCGSVSEQVLEIGSLVLSFAIRFSSVVFIGRLENSYLSSEEQQDRISRGDARFCVSLNQLACCDELLGVCNVRSFNSRLYICFSSVGTCAYQFWCYKCSKCP